jgi:hypothetical protein
MSGTSKTGSFGGKSNKLGMGGRAAQLKSQGVPGGVIGAIARKKHAAPGQANFHPSTKPVRQTTTPVATDRGKFGIRG